MKIDQVDGVSVTDDMLRLLLRKMIALPGPYGDIMDALTLAPGDLRTHVMKRCAELWRLHELEEQQRADAMRRMQEHRAPVSMPIPGEVHR